MNSEKERLSELYRLAVLDTAQEADFDHIVELASQICGTPISLISLVDLERQWFKANKGFQHSETSRSLSFCTHTIQQQEIMVVSDATKDVRFADNPLVTEDPCIRFYAGAPLLSSSGHILGSLCVIDLQPRDLTTEQSFALKTLSRQVVAQLELRQRNRQLQELLEAKDRILSVISHDLKSPLSNIRQIMSMFADGEISSNELNLISAALSRSVDKAESMLSELISWFLAQAEGARTNFSEVNLNKLLLELVNENTELLNRKQNKVQLCISPLIMLHADAGMLRFIFRNLLLNANKFTEKGSVEVYAMQLGASVQISVKDSGRGISAERVRQLLHRKKVSSTAGTANEQGHGLGLLLVQEFIDRHHGSLHIISEPGKGTEVQVFLPVSKAAPGHGEPPAGTESLYICTENAGLPTGPPL